MVWSLYSNRYCAPFLVFLVVYYAHGLSTVLTASSDSRWSIYTAHSILHEGNLSLEEFESELKRQDDYCIHRVHSVPYNLFPPISGVLAVPFVALYEFSPTIAGAVLPGLKTGPSPPSVFDIRARLERAVASFIVALTSVLLFIMARERVSLVEALLVVFLFAFATSAWSVASRSLWQHGPSMLFVSLSLLLVMRGISGPSASLLLGVSLALAYLSRPTNALFVAFLGAYQLYRSSPSQRFMVVGAAAPLLAVFMWWSSSAFGSLLPPYYHPQRLDGFGTFSEALVGNLISPARGLLIFSPFLVFSFWGFVLLLRSGNDRLLALFVGASIVSHWIAISLFPHWWGGYSYGPRLMSDSLPLLLFGLLPVVPKIVGQLKMRSLALPVFFFVLSTISFAIHYRGANHQAVQRWNKVPESIDKSPHRLWNWLDPPFLR